MSINLRIAPTAAGPGIRSQGPTRKGAAGGARSSGLATGGAFVGAPSGPALKIVVIERRALIRECLVRCLRNTTARYTVVDFASVTEWEEVRATHPSAVLIVLCMQDGQESEVERDLTHLTQDRTNIPIVVLSDVENTDHILSALECGARGYIPTSVTLDVAVQAMHLVEAGGTFVPADTLYASRRRDEPEQKSADARFTARQAAVVDALRQGKANKQIAYELNMREGTVKVHVRNIMKKLKARNRTEVAILASSTSSAGGQ